ncbi:MAG TPA: helix-turn-helix transcriptional regulator [Rudaea sp.]|nr:helix-turn-helix transcriptional regulator [Rudaea sp.]
MGEELTRRELEVAALVYDGFSDKAIAKRLGIAIRTVRKHIDAAGAKLPPLPGECPGWAKPRPRIYHWWHEQGARGNAA